MGLWHSVVWREQQQFTWRVCVSDQQPTGSEGSLGGGSEQSGCLVCTQEMPGIPGWMLWPHHLRTECLILAHSGGS